MKLSKSCLLALASVSSAKKGGKKNKENDHHVIVSGKERAFGEHCLAEQNEDGILTMTTTIGLNEVASCHRQLGCRDGYTLARNIASIDGLNDCYGCELDMGWSCNSNYEHNSFKFKYRIRLQKIFFGVERTLTTDKESLLTGLKYYSKILENFRIFKNISSHLVKVFDFPKS